jgi:hypothetical protein
MSKVSVVMAWIFSLVMAWIVRHFAFVAGVFAVAFLLGLPGELLASPTYAPSAIADPGANPVEFESLKTFMFSQMGKAMAAGMSIAGVFIAVRVLWRWLTRA